MRSRQKRALFQREFGAALLPRGFVYRENMFLRLHPGEVLLAVGLDLAPSSGGYVEYGVLPFCNGISRPPFSGLARVAVRDGRRWEDIFHAREQWQVMEEQSAQLERQWRENPCARSMEAVRAIEELSYLKRFYEQYFSFFKDVFERFARVTSTREALAFHEWAIGFYNANPMPSILECVAVGEYEKALAYARFALERTQKTWQGNLKSRLDPPERGKRNANRAQELREYQNLALKKNQEAIRRAKQDVDDLEYGRYGRFQAQIAANKALSFQSCAEIFPEMEERG